MQTSKQPRLPLRCVVVVAAAMLVAACGTKKKEGPAPIAKTATVPAAANLEPEPRPAPPAEEEPAVIANAEALTETLDEDGCLGLVAKFHELSPGVKDDSMDIDILSHCDGNSGPDDLKVQACLHAADEASAMEDCFL